MIGCKNEDVKNKRKVFLAVAQDSNWVICKKLSSFEEFQFVFPNRFFSKVRKGIKIQWDYCCVTHEENLLHLEKYHLIHLVLEKSLKTMATEDRDFRSEMWIERLGTTTEVIHQSIRIYYINCGEWHINVSNFGIIWANHSIWSGFGDDEEAPFFAVRK